MLCSDECKYKIAHYCDGPSKLIATECDQTKQDHVSENLIKKDYIYGIKYVACRILAGRSEGKRLLGKPRCRWVDNIKKDHREIGWGGMDWIHLSQDRDQWRARVNMVMKLQVP
jgi:hypothetical protein